MTKPRKQRKRAAPVPAMVSGESETPKPLADTFDRKRILDGLSPDARATLAKYAVSGAPAEKLPLAAGDTLSERMRHPSRLGQLIEADYPNIREAEANAPEQWASYRESQKTWRAELEDGIASRRQAFAEGNLGALLDTLVHCTHRDGCLFGGLSSHGEHWVEVPRWAIDALTVLLSETLPSVRDQKKGKHARWLTAWKQDQLDLERWKTVRMLREHGVSFSLGKVYETAARLLGSEVPVGADSVRRSYMRVQKLMKTQPGRYLPLDYGGAINSPD